MGVHVSRRTRSDRVVVLDDSEESERTLHVRFADSATSPRRHGRAASPDGSTCWAEQHAPAARVVQQREPVPWPRGPPCAVSSSDDECGPLNPRRLAQPQQGRCSVAGAAEASPSHADEASAVPSDGAGAGVACVQEDSPGLRSRGTSSGTESSGWPAGQRCDLASAPGARPDFPEEGEEGGDSDSGRELGSLAETPPAERKRKLTLELYNQQCSVGSDDSGAQAAAAGGLSPHHPWWHPELGPKPLRSTHSLMSALSTPPRCLPAPTSPAAPVQLPGVHTCSPSVMKAGLAWVMNAAPARPARRPRRFVF